MPRITVLMGIYNCASTLLKSLDSLEAQTYSNFKVIMCDDGSIDDTAQIAREYVKRNPNRYILISNPRNMGLNYTLNRCLEYADTEYCARMDGDDISLPNRFEEEVKFLDEHPEYQIVSTPMIYFDEKGDFMTGVGGFEPTREVCSRATPFCHAPCMVRTEAYREVGGYTVNPSLLRVEDYHLWVKMMAKGYRGYMLDKPLYKMRDDRTAIRRRTFRNTLRILNVQRFAIRKLHLPLWHYIFCLRPLIVGLLPKALYTFLHHRNMQ